MINKHWVVVVFVAVLSLLLFWTPFKLGWNGTGMNRIVQNFDGLNFLIVAKTAYDPQLIERDYQEVLSGRKPLYFSAHYPGLPILIRVYDTITTGPNALLLAIITSNILLALVLYWFFDWYTKDGRVTVLLSIVTLFFPARMLAVRAVGSNEMLFIFFVLTSLLLHNQRRRWEAAIMGSLAVLTRSPGIILFMAYFFSTWYMVRGTWLEKIKEFIPYLLIPLTLLGLWVYYGFVFGSFWSYFQVGGNINLYYPFAVFASNMPWVGEIWLEDIVYLTAFMVTGIFLFIKRKGFSAATLFAILYATFTLCVAHRDLARYSIPIMPFVIAGWSEIIPNKVVKLLGYILVIPIFLYAWQFVLSNYQVVADWTKYL